MSESKSYRVGFFLGVHGSDDIDTQVGDIFEQWADNDGAPAVEMGTYFFQIRNITVHKGSLITGRFGKLRGRGLPTVADTDGNERPIDIEDHEGLLEVNHFIYYRDQNLLVFLHNGHAATTTRLGSYITSITGETTVFNPILQPEATKRLLGDKVEPVKLELSFARPTNPDLYTDFPMTKDLMNLLSHSNAGYINLTLSMGKVRDHLNGAVRQAASHLVEDMGVRKAKFTVEEDGSTYPIDLIADKLSDFIKVEMYGHYPDDDEVYESMRQLKSKYSDILNEILGEAGEALE